MIDVSRPIVQSSKLSSDAPKAARKSSRPTLVSDMTAPFDHGLHVWIEREFDRRPFARADQDTRILTRDRGDVEPGERAQGRIAIALEQVECGFSRGRRLVGKEFLGARQGICDGQLLRG